MLVAAPSNIAVDHLAERTAQTGLRVVRLQVGGRWGGPQAGWLRVGGWLGIGLSRCMHVLICRPICLPCRRRARVRWWPLQWSTSRCTTRWGVLAAAADGVCWVLCVEAFLILPFILKVRHTENLPPLYCHRTATRTAGGAPGGARGGGAAQA